MILLRRTETLNIITYTWKIFLVLPLLISACSIHKINPIKPNAEAAATNTKLAMSYLEIGATDRAEQKIQLALQQDEGNPAVWSSNGYFLEKTGNLHQAEKAYLHAVHLSPHSGAVHNNYGAFLCRQKQYSAAIKQFTQAVDDKTYANIAKSYENAGHCALQIPDPILAKEYFQLSSNYR